MPLINLVCDIFVHEYTTIQPHSFLLSAILLLAAFPVSIPRSTLLAFALWLIDLTSVTWMGMGVGTWLTHQWLHHWRQWIPLPPQSVITIISPGWDPMSLSPSRIECLGPIVQALCRQLFRVLACHRHVISLRHLFVALISIIWLLQSWFVFFSIPWALVWESVIRVTHSRLNMQQSLVLSILTSHESALAATCCKKHLWSELRTVPVKRSDNISI